jgi:bacterioferritin
MFARRSYFRELAVQAKAGVVEHLNTILTNELTAINQYLLQSRMCSQWGYERLARKLVELSVGEQQDAATMIKHILYLEGVPNMQRLNTVRIGQSVLEHLELTLELEKEQVAAMASAIQHCAGVGDFTTRGILEDDIRDEEEHVDWIETQLETIKQIGLERYLAEQIQEQ